MTSHAVSPRQRARGVAKPTSLPLRLVAPVRSRASRAPFVVVLLAVLGAGLVGLIVLSTVLQAQAFEIAKLQSQADELSLQQQQLTGEVDDLNAPAQLARRAIALGMVPNTNPAFLSPEDGAVVGSPKPAEPRTNVKQVDQ